MPSPSCQARTTAAASTEPPGVLPAPPPTAENVSSKRTDSRPGSPSVITRSRGRERRRRLDDPGRVAREIPAPASELRDEARRVRAVVAGAAAGQEVQLGAQPLDRPTLGRHVAQRNRAAQVDQLARVDARDRRRAVDQRRQHAEAGGGLIELENDARGEVAHDRGQSVAADIDSGAPRQIGQHHGHQLPHLGGRERAPLWQVLQPDAAELGLAEAVQRSAPVVLAQHHASRHRAPHARVGRDGESHLGGSPRAGGVGQRGDGQDLLLGDRDRHAVELDPPGARQDPHQPVELGRQQHGAVRRRAARLQQRVRAQIHVLDLQPRGLGRVGEAARQRAAERCFTPVRLDQHAREPQSSLAAREAVADPRDHALGRRGAFFLRRRQGDRRRRDVLAWAHPRGAVTLRFVFGGVEDHRRRHDPSRGSHPQHDLFGAARLDGDRAGARERHTLRPQPRLAAAADRRQQGFEGRGGGRGGHRGTGMLAVRAPTTIFKLLSRPRIATLASAWRR